MAGIAIVLDLVRKNPSFNTQTLLSSRLFSASLAASTAAATVASPFVSRAFFGIGGKSVAYCDAGAEINEDVLSCIRDASKNIFPLDVFPFSTKEFSTKEYNIELKPLFSAFQWKFFALTSLRSFLLFYLPLLEPRANMEEDDDDFLEDIPGEQGVDLVVPFKKSVKQIIRETTVVTTRRILERLAVHYVSQRIAWKLLKDVPRSAVRKAGRGMPMTVYFFSVSRTTFRGHFLGVAASWVVTVGIEVYHFLSSTFNTKEETDTTNKAELVQRLGKKVYVTAVRCGAQLIFASIGAGVGALILRPSVGQWLGCAIGDMAGPIIVSFCLRKACMDF